MTYAMAAIAIGTSMKFMQVVPTDPLRCYLIVWNYFII